MTTFLQLVPIAGNCSVLLSDDLHDNLSHVVCAVIHFPKGRDFNDSNVKYECKPVDNDLACNEGFAQLHGKSYKTSIQYDSSARCKSCVKSIRKDAGLYIYTYYLVQLLNRKTRGGCLYIQVWAPIHGCAHTSL